MSESTNVIRFAEKLALVELGLSTVYKDTLKAVPNQYKEWLAEKSTDLYIETDYGVGGLGVMQEKAIGDRFPTDRLVYGGQKSYTMATYGISLVLQYEVIRYDLYGVYGDLGKKLADTAISRYDLVAYGVFNNGFVTTNSVYTNYLGEALFSTSHRRMDGGTWTNRPSTDIGLSMTALQTATTTLKRTTNERGILTNQLVPRKVIVAVENEWLLNTLLDSKFNPENANMQVNNAARLGLSSHVTPYILTSTYWFVACEKDSYQLKLAHGDRPDLMQGMEPNTRNKVFTSYCAFRMQTFQSRGLFGSTGV